MAGKKAIGIDLGTTYSAIARLNEAGHPEIIPNAEGERITASAVFIAKDGRIEVGQGAVDAFGLGPERLIRWVKRRMDDPDWTVAVDGRSYSAVDISAMILSKLRKDASALIGDITSAVITVPAYFGEIQRKATMDAARLAGIEVLRLINEPTAAALTYAASGRVTGTALIYDLGGGTFDVSVVEIESPTKVTVRSTEGDHRLGGYDFDVALAEHLLADVRGANPDLTAENIEALDALSRHRLIDLAEKTKRQLSKKEMIQTDIALDGRLFSVNLERAAFEAAIGEYVTRTEMLVEAALRNAGVTPAEVDTVILVGGSTRIPIVQALNQRIFGQQPLVSVAQDEAVAHGASIQAGIVLAERGDSDLPAAVQQGVRGISLQDVASHSYGTIALSDVDGTQLPRNDILIPKNAQIPAEVTKEYYTTKDDQRLINCRVTQGEDEDPEFVTVLWSEHLDLPSGRPKNQEIQVTFSYDENQRMSCDFLDVASGRRKHVTLDLAAQGGPGGPAVVPASTDIDFDDLDIV